MSLSESVQIWLFLSQWTVNGLLRIGFFSVRDVKAGEELTFDYKFQRFG